MNSSLATILLLLTMADPSESDITPVNPELKAIAARAAIVQGELHIRTRYSIASTWDGSKDDVKLATERRFEVFFDGENYRVDMWKDNGSNTAVHKEIDIIANGKHLYYTGEKRPSGQIVAAHSKSLDTMDQAASTLVPNPKLLGMAPFGYASLLGKSLKSLILEYIGKPKKGTLSQELVDYKGMQCWKVKYAGSKGTAIYRTWIAPELDYNIVRVELEFDHMNKKVIDSVVSEIKQDESSGMFFPVHCTYLRQVDGKTVEKQDIQITVVQLGKPLPKSTFELAGMNLPIDMPVTVVPDDDRGNLKWNGQELVQTKHTHKENQIIPSTQSGGNYRWLVIANCFAFALLAAFLLWRHFNPAT